MAAVCFFTIGTPNRKAARRRLPVQEIPYPIFFNAVGGK
jgi:hypothetical protein